MLKNPFEYLTEFSKDKLERDRKTDEFIYNQTDSFISWLIGFSVTGLLLIVSNVDKLKTNFNNITKPIIVFILITIIIGIAFRYVSYLMMIFQKGLENYFAGLYSSIEMTPIEVSEDIPAAGFDYILLRLKDDFNEIIQFPRVLTEDEKQIELPKLIEHYTALCNYSKKQLDIAVNHLADINETAYKIDKKRTVAAFKRELQNPNIGYNLLLWHKIRGWLYLLTILSFLTAIIIVCIHLLFQ